jgi:putative SOS response-associated peptidase YedK
MCGRYVMQESLQELAERFGVDVVTVEAPRPPSWNVAPTQPVVAVASSRDGATRRLGELRWGLVPSWAKDPSVGSRMINARAETVATNRAFAPAFERRRCLLPASGYYEWQKTPVPGSAKPARQAYYLSAADGAVLALAGLWEVWRDAEGQAVRSCTVITTEANDALSGIHDRMPVIVPAVAWDRWLHPGPLEPAEAETVLAPAPDALLVAWRVGDRVNNANHDGADLIEPYCAGD